MGFRLCRVCGSKVSTQVFLLCGATGYKRIFKPHSLAAPGCRNALISTSSRTFKNFQGNQEQASRKSDSDSASSGDKTSAATQFPKLWEDPYRYAYGPLPPQPKFTEVVESTEEWKWVERLFPQQIIPEIPKHEKYPTPSGWSPPRDPGPDLPYYVRRTRYHVYPLYLECRRDQLDPKTMEFNYVELVVMKHIEGDVFVCERDLKCYLEGKLGRKVATHVNEPQGKIRVKGADRTLLEDFLKEKGF